jgi:hypothetical protein
MHRKKLVFLGFSSYFLPIFYKENEFLNYIPLLKINRIGKLSGNYKKKNSRQQPVEKFGCERESFG